MSSYSKVDMVRIAHRIIGYNTQRAQETQLLGNINHRTASDCARLELTAEQHLAISNGLLLGLQLLPVATCSVSRIDSQSRARRSDANTSTRVIENAILFNIVLLLGLRILS
jgi:hypothetical protein